jgi:uncharacterized protein
VSNRFAQVAFTPAVKQAQQRHGSREQNTRVEARSVPQDQLGRDEAAFIAVRDSFCIATVSETGWPYIQHRGGPRGFLKVLDPHTLGFADYRGNRQYVSVGNIAGNDRVALILMDYANGQRLKLFGRATTVDATQDRILLERLRDSNHRARVERGVLLRVEAFDWNCPLHITPRFTKEEIEAAIQPLRARIRELEQRLANPG